MTLDSYLPVILFILVGIGVGVAPQVLGFLLGPRRTVRRRLNPEPPLGQAGRPACR